MRSVFLVRGTTLRTKCVENALSAAETIPAAQGWPARATTSATPRPAFDSVKPRANARHCSMNLCLCSSASLSCRSFCSASNSCSRRSAAPGAALVHQRESLRLGKPTDVASDRRIGLLHSGNGRIWLIGWRFHLPHSIHHYQLEIAGIGNTPTRPPTTSVGRWRDRRGRHGQRDFRFGLSPKVL